MAEKKTGTLTLTKEGKYFGTIIQTIRHFTLALHLFLFTVNINLSFSNCEGQSATYWMKSRPVSIQGQKSPLLCLS